MPFIITAIVAMLSALVWPAMPTLTYIYALFFAALLMSLLGRRTVAGALFGVAWLAQAGAYYLTEQQAITQQAAYHTISGQVLSAEASRFGQKIILQGQAIAAHPWWQRSINRSKFILYSSAQHQFKHGQSVRLLARLKPAHGTVNPSGFSYTRYLLSQSIIATGSVKKVLHQSGDGTLRQSMLNGIYHDLAPLPQAGVLYALISGERAYIDKHLNEQIRQAGLSHLLVISGLHVAIVGMWSFFLLRLIFLPLSTHGKTLAMLGAFLLALAYVALANWQVPAFRALIMFALVLLGLWKGSLWRAWQGLFIAAGLILLLWPLSIFAYGFYLSFAATAIVLFALWWQPWPRYLTPLWLQLVIVIAMLPLQVLLFGMSASMALLFNLLFIPLFSFVLMPLVILGLMAHLLGLSLDTFLWGLAAKLLNVLPPFLSWFEAHYTLAHATPKVAAIVLFLALLCWPLYLHKAGRVCLLLCFMLVVSLPVKRHSHDWGVTVLDVGQGLAVVVQQGARALLYDSGPRFGSGFNFAEAAIMPYLRDYGMTQLDYMVFSHADNDHSGGRRILEKSYPQAQRIYGNDLRFAKRNCHGTIQWQKLRLQLFSAKGLWGNEGSCLVHISDGKFSVLLSGDAGAQAERQIFAQKWGKVDLLISPHHGSKSANTRRWIHAFKPQYVVHSAGRNNRYGLPHPSTLKTYADANIAQFNTANYGALHWQIKAQQLTWFSEREHRQAYWYH